ncbi:Ankyrin-2 [Colletotrichum siamense]|nr:Ankyrin-2 [Colletotrichum siamense]
MADPLSISASIAGLVTLADTVFLRLTKYIKTVKNAEKEIDDLCKEVNLLAGAVSMLSRLARGHELEDEPFNKDFRMYHIEACAFILNEISQRTKKFDTSSKSKVLKLIWPYTSSKTKQLLAELSCHKENINLALSANSMEALLRCLANEEDRAKSTAEIRADVQKTREIVVRIQQNSYRAEVLRFFLHFNPQPNYEMSVKLRHPRTGLWLERLPSFQTWLSSPGSRLWLSGIPGAGKTVLAGSIIGQALARSSATVAVGFFFCDYKNDETQRPESILGALAHQLARQNEHAYMMLEDYYCELHPKEGLPRSPDLDALVRVIVTMAQAFDQVHLVVDGLDECQDRTQEVVRALCAIAESSDEISIAVLSRHEENIREYLQDPEINFINIQIAAHTEDITEYVTSEIQQRIKSKRLHIEDLSLESEIVDGLVEGAKGMYVVKQDRPLRTFTNWTPNRFRWVACQLDHLGYCISDAQCREALRSLPPDLPETYLRILERVPRKHQPFVQLTLDIVAFADPKPNIAQLREILSVPSCGSLLKPGGLVREDAISRHCGSLIRKSNNGEYLEFAHFSVQEFLRSSVLQSSGLQMFMVSEGRCNRLLATRCIEYLQLDNFNQPPTPTEQQLMSMEERDLDHPLYSFASFNWLFYARQEWSDSSLLAAAKLLFDPCKTARFTQWAVNLILQLMTRASPGLLRKSEKIRFMTGIIDKSFHPLHFAATLCLPEISSFLLMPMTHQVADSFMSRTLEHAVDCLYGASRLHGKYATTYVPAYIERIIGTPACKSQFASQTIRTVLQHLNKIPKDLVGVAIDCWAWTRDFSVIQLLVAKGGTLLQSNLHQFSRVMHGLFNSTPWHWQPDQVKSLLLLCECLSHMLDESPLHFELCRLVWEFSLKLKIDTENIGSYKIDPRVTEDQLSLERLAISACHHIKAGPLREAVKDPRIDVSSIVDSNTGNSLLHTMVIADHSYAKVRNETKWISQINELLELLLDGGCSLGLLNNEGHTPLSLALECQEAQVATAFLRRTDLEQINYNSPCPILLLVAKAGSDDVLDLLLRMGLKTSSADYKGKTPLHCLEDRAKLALAVRFEELFPGARQLLADGKLPWEAYLDATNFEPPYADVLEFLIQPFLHHDNPSEGSKIWEYYTTNLSRDGFKYAHKASDRVLGSLLKAGAMECYEKSRSQSGLLPITSIFSAFPETMAVRQFPFTDSTLCLLIESTDYWAAFRETLSAVQFLQLGISLEYDMTVMLLLERGVGVHRRFGGYSPLEQIYALPAIDDYSISIVRLFLRHSDPTCLSQTNPTSGLGLVHMFNRKDKSHFRRQILEITIRSGANPNLRTNFGLHSSSLVHHLEEKNFDLASGLLQSGADPTIPCRDGWSALHMAAYQDVTAFLLNLMSPNNSHWALDWNLGCFHSRGSESFAGVKPLHLAATGSTDFLMLLLDKVPSIDLEAKTDNGLTAVHFAALWGCENAVELLVLRGASVNAKSADGRQALHIAVATGNLGLVETLLNLNSEVTARLDGMTPLLLAYRMNHQPIINRLNAHTTSSRVAASVSENAALTAVGHAISGAIRANNLSACQDLLKETPLLDMDISNGRFSGFTPLAIAIRHGALQIVNWLLERGANANCQNGDGTSALQDMIEDESLNPILQTMLSKYLADGGSILSETKSLIYLAVDAGNTEALDVLLHHLRANEKEYE